MQALLISFVLCIPLNLLASPKPIPIELTQKVSICKTPFCHKHMGFLKVGAKAWVRKQARSSLLLRIKDSHLGEVWVNKREFIRSYKIDEELLARSRKAWVNNPEANMDQIKSQVVQDEFNEDFLEEVRAITKPGAKNETLQMSPILWLILFAGWVVLLFPIIDWKKVKRIRFTVMDRLGIFYKKPSGGTGKKATTAKRKTTRKSKKRTSTV